MFHIGQYTVNDPSTKEKKIESVREREKLKGRATNNNDNDSLFCLVWACSIDASNVASNGIGG